MQSASQQLFDPYAPSPPLIPDLTVYDRSVGDVTILDLAGNLTRGFAVQAFDDQVRRLMAEGARNLASNLEHMSEIDSSGFGGHHVARTPDHRFAFAFYGVRV